MIGRNIGPYRIVEQIGTGGMAIVYKAFDPGMDRYVALKVLPAHFTQDPEFRERFEREAKAIARLEHPHIVPVYGYGEEQDVAYIAIRYMPTGTLKERIKSAPLPLAETAHLLRQIADALDCAHENMILHRDVKPSNILIDANGNVYLMDFGISKIIEATVDLTKDSILGTPAYMSPEQCMGQKDITQATDIYALGIILYEMVTGHRPFDAETPMAIVIQQVNSPLPPPSTYKPDLPVEVETTILKALAKDPTLRYQTAGELASALEQAIATVPMEDELPTVIQPTVPPTEVVPPPTPSEDDQPLSRLPRWAFVIAGLALVAVVAFVLALIIRPWEEDSLTVSPEPAAAAVFATVEPSQEATVRPSPTFAATAKATEIPGPTRTNPPPFTTGGGLLEDSGQRLGDRRSTKVSLGDLDGDGDLDAFVTDWEQSKLWLNNGDGTYNDSGEAFEGGNHVDLGDLDNDSDLDAFVVRGLSQVWLNDGMGNLAELKQFSGDTNGYAVALGDVDGDGDLDAFVANAHPPQPNFVWLNDGTGIFYDSGQRLGNESSVAVELADLDNDGDLDAFVGNDGYEGQDNEPAADKVWLNDGIGNFVDSDQRLGPLRTMSVTLGDIDDDGDLDALTASCCMLGSRIWINDGSGTFGAAGRLFVFSDNQDIVLGDVDGDGDLDALSVNFGGEENDPQPDGVWLNNGQGRFVLRPDRILPGSYAAGAALGDLDGDGDLDAYIATIGGDLVYINQD